MRQARARKPLAKRLDADESKMLQSTLPRRCISEARRARSRACDGQQHAGRRAHGRHDGVNARHSAATCVIGARAAACDSQSRAAARASLCVQQLDDGRRRIFVRSKVSKMHQQTNYDSILHRTQKVPLHHRGTAMAAGSSHGAKVVFLPPRSLPSAIDAVVRSTGPASVTRHQRVLFTTSFVVDRAHSHGCPIARGLSLSTYKTALAQRPPAAAPRNFGRPGRCGCFTAAHLCPEA